MSYPDRARLASFAIVAIFGIATAGMVGACGGDDDGGMITPPDPTLPAELRIVLPAEHTPGTPLPVRWEFSGDVGNVAGARLLLRLAAPGAPLTATSAGYLFTGSAPATGEVWWIASDGSLVADQTAVADPVAATGEVTVTLPATIEGDWAVDALLLREDQILEVTSATTWSASGTAMRLALSRTWAGPDSVVRAAVVVRGTTGEMLRMSAWLTAPDGTVRSLPGLDDTQGYVDVVEGAIEPGRFELLAQPLGEYGEGKHLVTVKLETLTGEVRARAGAMVQVCSAVGTVGGTVTSGGDGSLLMLDPVDDTSFEGTIDAAGAYSIDVPAGRYLLLARGGAWTAGNAVEVGCGQTVDPALGAVAVASARHPRPARPVSHEPVGSTIAHGASSALTPRIQVMLDPGAGTVPRATGLALQASIVDTLTANARSLGGGPMTFIDEVELELLSGRALREQMGSERNNGATAALIAELDYDFYIKLGFATIGDEASTRYSVTASLIDPRLQRVLVHASRSGFEDPEQAGAEVARDILRATGATVQPLRPLLAAEIEFPQNPVLEINLNKTEFAPGETIIAIVRLSDASPPTPAEGVDVVGEWVSRTGTVVESFPLRTNELGADTFSIPVPAILLVSQRFDLRAKLVQRGNRTFYSPTKQAFADVSIPLGKVTLSKRIPMSNGDAVGVAVQVASNRVINLAIPTTYNAIFEGAATIRLDALNRAAFDVRTQAKGPGMAGVTLGLPSPFFGGLPQLVTIKSAFYAVSPLSITTLLDPDTRVLNNRVVAVKGVVLLEGAPYADAPVALTSVGGGLIVSGVRTDANGAYQALYVAPGAGMGTTQVTASAVLDGHSAEAAVSISWGPACGNCPLVITPSDPVNLEKGAVQVFAVNQDVTWTVSSGTITPAGVFTAPEEGGVVHVTATSVMDPARTVRVAVVVRCTIVETTGTFSGALTTSVGNPNCTGGLTVISRPESTGQYIYIGTSGCPYVNDGMGFVPFPTGTYCGYYHKLFSGCSQEVFVESNLAEPGNNSRVVTVRASTGTGQCTVAYQGSGILRQ